MTHLSPDVVERFKKRMLSATEVLEASEHLDVCAACRRACEGEERLRQTAAAFRTALDAAVDDHLSYEDLAAWVDKRLDEAGRQAADEHLAICPMCATELADLRETMIGLDSRRHTSARRWWFRVPIAAAASLAILVVTATMQTQRREIAELRQEIRDIRDIKERATTPAVPPAYRDLLADALNGRIETPAILDQLRPQSGVLLGPGAAATFKVLEPAGVVVESERPQFRWTPLANATNYTVAVHDSELRPVARSPNVLATQWQPDRPLPRGQTYLWQVTARVGGKEIVAPIPPAPEARFRILDGTAANELARARKALGDSHLLLGLLYARYGLLSESEREFQALIRHNSAHSAPNAPQ